MRRSTTIFGIFAAIVLWFLTLLLVIESNTHQAAVPATQQYEQLHEVEGKLIVARGQLEPLPDPPNAVLTETPLSRRLRVFPFGADGYLFARKTLNNYTPIIDLVEHPTRESLRQAAAKVKLPETTLAFTMLPRFENGFVCEIHIVDPSVIYEPEITGHEFLHCVYGSWHLNTR